MIFQFYNLLVSFLYCLCFKLKRKVCVNRKETPNIVSNIYQETDVTKSMVMKHIKVDKETDIAHTHTHPYNTHTHPHTPTNFRKKITKRKPSNEHDEYSLEG